MTEHIAWKENQLLLLDQRLLPFKKVYVKCRTLADVTRAIKNMTVRGAPLIGIVAAYGMYLGIREIQRSRKTIREGDAVRVYQSLAATRPTAVNLTWALDRMLSTYRQHGGSDNVLDLGDGHASGHSHDGVETPGCFAITEISFGVSRVGMDKSEIRF